MPEELFTKKNIAIFIALLFHFSGAIGILYSANKDWFIANTPLNLLLMTGLLLWMQPDKGIKFFLFFGISFLVGMGTEMIGVNTGKLFGTYEYGTVMGPKLNGVPYLIGINWFLVTFCCGVLLTKISDWTEEKYENMGVRLKPWMLTFAFVLDGGMLATVFDYNIEPVAVKLGFWHWKEDAIPWFNYVCWFAISAQLAMLFKKLDFDKDNQFAVHLLVIQALFFITLKIYLP